MAGLDLERLSAGQPQPVSRRFEAHKASEKYVVPVVPVVLAGYAPVTRFYLQFYPTDRWTMATLHPSALIVAANKSSSCSAATLGAHRWLGKDADVSTAGLPSPGLIAFGSNACIAVYDPLRHRVLALLAGHKARVNGVAWVHRPDKPSLTYQDENELVSCSADGTLRLWRIRASTDPSEAVAVEGPSGPIGVSWECVAVLPGHNASVTAVACHTASDGTLFIVSTSADCTLRGWVRPASAASTAGDIYSLGAIVLKSTGILEAVAITALPLAWAGIDSSAAAGKRADLSSYAVLIAAGGADCKLHLYTCTGDLPSSAASPSSVPSLRHLLSVSGPTDWIRCLAFSASSALVEHFGAPNVRGCFVEAEANVAAASQEGKLRIWKIKGKRTAAASSSSAVPAVADAVISAPAAGSADEEDELAPSASSSEDAAAGSSSSSVAGAASAVDPLAALLAAEDPVLAALQSPRTFTVDLPSFKTSLTFEVSLDALLSGGHDGWVNSVQWHPPVAVAVSVSPSPSSPAPRAYALMQPPCLLSASMDKSLTLWQPADPEAAAAAAASSAAATVMSSVATTGSTSTALVSAAANSATSQAAANALATIEASEHYSPEEKARLKERIQQNLAAAKTWEGIWAPILKVGAAGGAVAGFYGGLMTRDCAALFSHGFQGSLHLWRLHPSPNCPPDCLSACLLASAADQSKAGGIPLYPSPSLFSVSTLKDETILNQEPCAQGHASSVVDLAWSPTGSYLLSASSDFTTRAWAPISTSSSSAGKDSKKERSLPLWMEVGRPQIHGYEMAALTLPAHPDPRYQHRMFSAGDEKCPRVFDAPKLFLRTLAALSFPEPAADAGGKKEEGDEEEVLRARLLRAEVSSLVGGGGGDSAAINRRPEFAYVPELNLTNKAVHSDGVGAPIKDRYQADGRDAVGISSGGKGGGDEESAAVAAAAAAMATLEGGSGKGAVDAEGEGEERKTAPSVTASAAPSSSSSASTSNGHLSGSGSAVPVSSSRYDSVRHAFSTHGSVAPPLDEDEIQNTRWPEANKLFGHSHEVVTLAVNSSGTIVASACKARDEAHANVLLWSVETGEMLQSLAGNKLSVIQMAFSLSSLAVVPAASASAAEGEGCSDEQRFYRTGTIAAAAPTLTRTKEAAAAQSEFLVSVSKDRSIAIWGAEDSSSSSSSSSLSSSSSSSSSADNSSHKPPKYRLLTIVKEGHKRIIWSVDFAPLPSSCPGALFATGARDQVVKLWSLARSTSEVSIAAVLPPAESAVTAVAFAPISRRSAKSGLFSLLLAVGEESGALTLWQLDQQQEAEGEWKATKAASLPFCGRHVDAVRKLSWRPPLPPSVLAGEAGDKVGKRNPLRLQLASASMDETIKIHAVRWF